MWRRGAVVLLLLAGVAVSPAFAQLGKTTRIIVSFPPGGPVDLIARLIADPLGRELDRAVIVENRPGANGSVGAQAVAHAAADGATLWLTSVGAVAINPSLYPSLPYDVERDFAPVSLVVNNVEVLVVAPENPAANAAEFVAASRRKKEPTPIASSGIGSIPHLAIEQFAEASGANLLHVPYKGAAPAIAAVLGGEVAAFFGDVPGLIGYIRSGRLKPIGIAAARRHPLLPEVPTLAEQGIAGVDSNNWYALFAPARTPPPTIATLAAAVRRVLESPALHEKLLQTGAEPAPSSPQALAALLKRDTEKWARLIRAKGIRAE